jgi:cytochrome c-type biogenesis protein CcmH/NrfG
VVSEETRSHLEARKRDLYDAIRTLDRDRKDGVIDGDVYHDARSRYETEAAGILERLDQLQASTPVAFNSASPRSNRRLVVVGAGVAVLFAVALFLGGALRARTGTAAITGDVGQTTPAPVSAQSPQVLAAQGTVNAHPRDPNAELSLATAYVDVKDNRAANTAYLRAIRLAPHLPEARTMYAMFKGSGGDTTGALAQLSLVEREHPAYAKAWLVDGLLSSRVTAGLPRAIKAWHQFLALSPHASIAPQVRTLLASAEQAQKKHR